MCFSLALQPFRAEWIQSWNIHRPATLPPRPTRERDPFTASRAAAQQVLISVDNFLEDDDPDPSHATIYLFPFSILYVPFLLWYRGEFICARD